MSLTYQVQTYGCQMNAHDSERISGLLESEGYVPATAEESPDLVVLNTCAVRENADNRLYGNLGHLRPAKQQNPRMQIAVGGCLAQKDRDLILDRAPWVDVVFGTHNVQALPVLLERARHNNEAQVEILEALEVFPSSLPSRRDSAFAAWVSISVGCDNTCTFCIVPSLRGRQQDRPAEDIVAEVQALAGQGVVEVTLLGQNVNSYGAGRGERGAFADLLAAVGRVEGIRRVRFTSPHPRDFTPDVVEAMAATPTVMPQLHMPLQSGSDRILRLMRRSYRQSRYLDILRSVRDVLPQAAISTDVIVGFPGESEEDFRETLSVVAAARFASAFTFQYSARPGTDAASLPDTVSPEVVRERYQRLTELQERVSLEENVAQHGREVEVLVHAVAGKRGEGRMSGRARDGRLVHFEPNGAEVRPGDLVTVVVSGAAPHYLLADGGVGEVERTPGGDAWERNTSSSDDGPAVLLGLPRSRASTKV